MPTATFAGAGCGGGRVAGPSEPCSTATPDVVLYGTLRGTGLAFVLPGASIERPNGQREVSS